MPVASGRPGNAPGQGMATDAELSAAIDEHDADTTGHGALAATATAALTVQVADPARHTPAKVSLIHGGSSTPTGLNGSVSVASGEGYGAAADGLELTATGGLTSLGVRVALGSPYALGAAQAIVVAVDIPDVTKVGVVQVTLHHDADRTGANAWSRSTGDTPVQTLTNGLNVLRFPAALHQTAAGFTRATLKSVWGSPHYAQVAFMKTGGGAIDAGALATVKHMWAEKHDTAKLLIVADRGYTSWVDTAYPDLLALGAPVTFAPDINLFGSNPGTINAAITEAELAVLAAENGNSVSFHGQTGNATSGMSAAQLAAETAACIAWLRDRNYQGRIWRAAYVQNDAPYAQDSSVTDQLIGSGYSTSAAYTVRDADPIWPPMNQYAIRRESVENQNSSATNEAAMDDRFEILETIHGLGCYFFHRIDESDQYSTRQADWDYFLNHVSTGLAAGWLECVTFEDLFYGSGGNFVQRNGQALSYWSELPTTRTLT